MNLLETIADFSNNPKILDTLETKENQAWIIMSHKAFIFNNSKSFVF